MTRFGQGFLAAYALAGVYFGVLASSTGTPQGRVAKIFTGENCALCIGAIRSDRAISGPSNRFTDLGEGGEQASRRAVRR